MSDLFSPENKPDTFSLVINAQSCIDAATIEKLGLKGRPEMIREGGGWSAIISPMGRIIAGPHRDTETILVADIDFTEIAMFKYVADSAGHYARPDVLQLAVNFGPQPVTAPLAGSDAAAKRDPAP